MVCVIQISKMVKSDTDVVVSMGMKGMERYVKVSSMNVKYIVFECLNMHNRLYFKVKSVVKCGILK